MNREQARVSGGQAHRARNRKRWVMALVLLTIALGAGSPASRREWRPRSARDPLRLELLQAALKEFNAKSYEAASATLDRRAAEVAPTSLDWMLRARIAQARGRTAEALDDLKHIPDSAAISAKSWLLTGQLEMAGGMRERPRRLTGVRSKSTRLRFSLIASWPICTRYNAGRRIVTPSLRPGSSDEPGRRSRLRLVPELLWALEPERGV